MSILRRFSVAFAVVAVVLMIASYASAQCAGGAGAQTGLAAVSCSGIPAWNPTGSYVVGSQVVYNNCMYRANQAFTSNSSWCPGCAGVYLYGNGSACPTAGCLYGAQGPCSGGATPTSTATPRNTPTPTATSRVTPTNTPTSTATPRATPTTPSGCAAAWNSANSYSTGQTVSRACGSVTANFTDVFYANPGDDPCTKSGITGSGMPWGLPMGCNVSAPTGSGVSGVLSSGQFDQIFPTTTYAGSRNGFYTYNGLVAGGNATAGFATTGGSVTEAREVAAFLANSSLETQRGFYIDEVNKNGPGSAPYYCGNNSSTSTCNGYTFPCDANHWYYGRGWLQLSWDFNYCSASVFVFGAGRHDYIDSPNTLSTNATANTQASLWYWMTQHTTTSPQKSAHACMTDGAGSGFGCTIAAINGPLECPGSQAEINRGTYYNSIISLMGVTAVGPNGC